MSDEDTDQSILEWNTGSSRDLRDYLIWASGNCINYNIWGRTILPEIIRSFARCLRSRNSHLREHGDRADRQLPVMSLELIIVVGVKETFPQSTFRLFVGTKPSLTRVFMRSLSKIFRVMNRVVATYQRIGVISLDRTIYNFPLYARMRMKIRCTFCILNVSAFVQPRWRCKRMRCNFRRRSNYSVRILVM